MASESNNDRSKEEIKTAKIGPLMTINTSVESEEAVEAKRQQILLPCSLLRLLKEIKVSEYEIQNVLTYALQTYSTDIRLEYMAFVEDSKIEHSWLALLSWWNHRHQEKDTTYSEVYNEKSRIEVFNGWEKVMGVARLYTPYQTEIDAVSTVMKEHMTTPYRYHFEAFVHNYSLPKCLRILKLWLWDVRDGRQMPPDPTEDDTARYQRISQLLVAAHRYDGVNKFPKLSKNSGKLWMFQKEMESMMTTKRHRSPSLQRRPYQGYTPTKIVKLELSDGDESDHNDAEIPPPPPPPLLKYEPVTPPRPPTPHDDNDDGSRPP